MGCACAECLLSMQEAEEQHVWWEGKGKALLKTLPEEMGEMVKKELNPQAFACFDQYCVYNCQQALPRYLVSFTGVIGECYGLF